MSWIEAFHRQLQDLTDWTHRQSQWNGIAERRFGGIEQYNEVVHQELGRLAPLTARVETLDRFATDYLTGLDSRLTALEQRLLPSTLGSSSGMVGW